MSLLWEPDHLGPEYWMAALGLPPDDEGPCTATLVAHTPSGGPSFGGLPPESASGHDGRDFRPVRAVLYVHGWSDYFFQEATAEFFTDRGIAFFAVDLRKFGRSLRPWQTPGYITDLAEYDADINAAIDALTDVLRDRHGGGIDVSLTLMAHSAGALTAVLWAARNPGRARSLVLNGPWLDTQGSALLRTATQGVLGTVSRFRPKARLRVPELGFYWRSISRSADGEWDLLPSWRPETGFPLRAGWFAAILAGQAEVARGLSLPVPVLVMASGSSTISTTWSEAMLESDSVLDVSVMVRRAVELGSCVTVCRFDGALHDVLLSRAPVRSAAYRQLGRWLDAYGFSGAVAPGP
ncbi:alpha/beta hydrolase [Arthrobacter sp. Br18]|uniref:alpha/beta hydrolase n=1 Tax=Arthrobacter sp. Br18 TaxID=1312954 RepID=UPI00056817D9|nr:alpha/beta hydrolase [Arthrobacter sp. Br18]